MCRPNGIHPWTRCWRCLVDRRGVGLQFAMVPGPAYRCLGSNRGFARRSPSQPNPAQAIIKGLQAYTWTVMGVMNVIDMAGMAGPGARMRRTDKVHERLCCLATNCSRQQQQQHDPSMRVFAQSLHLCCMPKCSPTHHRECERVFAFGSVQGTRPSAANHPTSNVHSPGPPLTSDACLPSPQPPRHRALMAAQVESETKSCRPVSDIWLARDRKPVSGLSPAAVQQFTRTSNGPHGSGFSPLSLLTLLLIRFPICGGLGTPC